jgi:hypothetical protein
LIDTSERDYQWFEAHPGVFDYIRPYVPGEADRSFDAEPTHTRVVFLPPGGRMREYFADAQ